VRPGRIARALLRALTAAARGLRALSGDDAYERYLTHHARSHPGPALSRGEFYRQREERKWSGVSRCC
jgi:uncharacterized short protein YbdD (DUF466 family)